MSFANLKKSSKGAFADLTKKIEDSKSGGYGDDRYWKFECDKANNGYAVVRFLPAPPGEDMPFVKIYEHAFKDPKTNKWYIENSRTTLGETDPVSEANSELWNTGIESNKEIARKRKRNTKYIVNILVVQDAKHPENEGKHFLWKMGPRLFQKIESALNPEFEDEKPINPFDMWEGANFKVKAREVDKQRSYDKSEFDSSSALFDGDDKALEKLWNGLYSLQAEIAPEKFKPYAELQKRFLQVTGQVGSAAAPENEGRGSVDVQRESSRRGTSRPADDDDAPSRESAKSVTSEADDEYAAYAALLED